MTLPNRRRLDGELLIMVLGITILYYIKSNQVQTMPTSVRLDPETEALLNRLAHNHSRTKSDILREALHRLAQDEQVDEVDNGPYALVADLIGIAHGGSEDLARRHKQAFRDLLAKR